MEHIGARLARVGGGLLAIGVLAAALSPVRAGEEPGAPAPGLDRLREDYAAHFFSPGAHMPLARWLHEHGDDGTAFFLLEFARRGLFLEDEFNRAFAADFRGDPVPDTSDERRDRLAAALEKSPEDPDLLHDLADLHVAREEYEEALPLLRRLRDAEPGVFSTWRAISTCLFRLDRKDEAERVLAEFAERWPESPDGYLLRVRALPRSSDAGAGKKILLAAAARYPEDGRIQVALGKIAAGAGDVDEAARRMDRARELAPDSLLVQGSAARFFLKTLKDESRAISGYLAAYLIHPHYYDGEYAEWRIRDLGKKRGAREVEQRIGKEEPLPDLLTSPDPWVVRQALRRMGTAWRQGYEESVAGLLARDDPWLADAAATLLGQKAGPGSDERLAALLASPDQRVRARALYVLGGRKGEAALAALAKALESDVELVRYDAAGALFLMGGAAARDLLVAHREKEPVPRLVEIIDADLEDWPGVPPPAEKEPEESKPVPPAGESATVVTVGGEVRNGAGGRIEAGARLVAGTTLVLGDGAKVELALPGGGVLRTSGPAHFRLKLIREFAVTVELRRGSIDRLEAGDVTIGVTTPLDCFVAVLNGTVSVRLEEADGRRRAVFSLLEGRMAKVFDGKEIVSLKVGESLTIER